MPKGPKDEIRDNKISGRGGAKDPVEKTTKEELSQIARKAAKTRWE